MCIIKEVIDIEREREEHTPIHRKKDKETEKRLLSKKEKTTWV
jgi:hypothetical protein